MAVFIADNFVRFADKSWLTCSNFFAKSVFQTKADTPEAKCGLSPSRSMVESTISIVFEFDFFFEAFNQLETGLDKETVVSKQLLYFTVSKRETSSVSKRRIGCFFAKPCLETAVQNRVTFRSGGSSDFGKIFTKKSLIYS